MLQVDCIKVIDLVLYDEKIVWEKQMRLFSVWKVGYVYVFMKQFFEVVLICQFLCFIEYI